MSELDPKLKKLDGLQGLAVPGRTVVLSRPTLKDGHGSKDAIAQITKVAVEGTPKGDHYFKLSLPDKPNEFRGAIEVDSTEPGEPNLRILAGGIFEEEPAVLGAVVGVGLTESGVAKAIIESRFTNLSPDFLRKTGGKIIQEVGESSGEPVLEFYSTPSDQIYDHPIAA